LATEPAIGPTLAASHALSSPIKGSEQARLTVEYTTAIRHELYTERSPRLLRGRFVGRWARAADFAGPTLARKGSPPSAIAPSSGLILGTKPRPRAYRRRAKRAEASREDGLVLDQPEGPTNACVPTHGGLLVCPCTLGSGMVEKVRGPHFVPIPGQQSRPSYAPGGPRNLGERWRPTLSRRDLVPVGTS